MQRNCNKVTGGVINLILKKAPSQTGGKNYGSAMQYDEGLFSTGLLFPGKMGRTINEQNDENKLLHSSFTHPKISLSRKKALI